MGVGGGLMEYFAETKKLTKILNDPRLILKNYGESRAKRIQARLDEFDAAKTLAQIPSNPPVKVSSIEGKITR